MAWLRFYVETLDDPKVQRLPGETFKGWVNLLCLAKRHDGVLPPISDTAFALRMSEETAEALINELAAAGLLDVTETGLSPHNWNGRQYKSDVSSERVKRHRERSTAVSSNAPRNVSLAVSETPPEQSRAETESDSETEGEKRALPPGFEIPEAWKQEALVKHPGIDPNAQAERFIDHHREQRTISADWQATWRKWCSRAKDFGQIAEAAGAGMTAADADRIKATVRALRAANLSPTAFTEASGIPAAKATMEQVEAFIRAADGYSRSAETCAGYAPSKPVRTA